jgi:hypothetical protein
LALAVPLSRFTSRVGGGSAFYVRPLGYFMTNKTPQQRGSRWIWLVVGCTIFGALMSVREEFQSVWIRAGVAGCAGIVLGVSLLYFRKVRA